VVGRPIAKHSPVIMRPTATPYQRYYRCRRKTQYCQAALRARDMDNNKLPSVQASSSQRCNVTTQTMQRCSVQWCAGVRVGGGRWWCGRWWCFDLAANSCRMQTDNSRRAGLSGCHAATQQPQPPSEITPNLHSYDGRFALRPCERVNACVGRPYSGRTPLS